VLVRFAYPAVSNAFAALRLLPKNGREKDAEILALHHQIGILLRQLGSQRVRFLLIELGRRRYSARCRAERRADCSWS
jgi:hypothetical protein